MEFTRFQQLISVAQNRPKKSRCAVVAPEDLHTVQAVLRASREGLIFPILIGDENVITELLAVEQYDKQDAVVIHEMDHVKAVQIAVDLCNEGKADCIMKGLVETATLMRVVLKKENNMRTGGLVSMLSIREMPNYHKLIAFTDAGISINPNLDEKRKIIDNAVSAMISMGYDTPKVAVLAAVETVNPKMQDTVDAAELKSMNQAGVIKNCIVEGPLSYDLAVSKEAAQIKGIDSPVAGNADLIVFPNLSAANMTTKAITLVSGVPVGSIIIGTKKPIIATSRASSADTKYMCIALAAASGGM